MLSLNMSSVWAQEALPVQQMKWMTLQTRIPMTITYCLRRVCNDLKSQQYDSVRYYLERAMFGNENKFLCPFRIEAS